MNSQATSRSAPPMHKPAGKPKNAKSATKLRKQTNSLLTSNFVTSRNGGLEEMRARVEGLRQYLSDPTKTPSSRVVEFYNSAVRQYDKAVRASIGMPGYSDDVTTQREAPPDIPTLPLDGYQLLQRVCHITKTANLGTTAGGFYAELKPSDFQPFVKGTYFRVKSVTSWTGSTYGSVGSQFAGVSVPVTTEAGGTEVMPMWSENWTPIGKGFAGITTTYPLGDFPQMSNASTFVVLTHFTSLGGAGGVTGVPVIFHAVIECLI